MEPAKVAARAQWTEAPCGTRELVGLEDLAAGTVAERDDPGDPWIVAFVASGGGVLQETGGAFLEIGCGIGVDLIRWAQHGARVGAVDLTERHVDLARRHCAISGVDADIRQADAADLPFPAASFDIVYSNGVLHHTPDTVRV